jgi:hypothetical protein
MTLFNDDEHRQIKSFICIVTGRIYCRARVEGREIVRDSVLLEKDFGVRHKFDLQSNYSELRDS